MKTWNIGNTTVRNPYRLREALGLFRTKMSGRPFRRAEQQEFLNELVMAGLVDSERAVEGDDGGRKFASAFKQLGFVTDWAHGKAWNITPVGTLLIEHSDLEENIFLRQLLKYQIPSPLEPVSGFQLRPFRLLLRFLKRAYDEQLIGLTKFEIGLYVITVSTEDDAAFEAAFSNIKVFRTTYDSVSGKVAKTRFAFERMKEVADGLGLQRDTLMDYADSNSRYALMSGLLTLRGNKLAISEARLPFIQAILTDNSTLIANSDYLAVFYNPESPPLPTDNQQFLLAEIAMLEPQIIELAGQIGETLTLPVRPVRETLLTLQGYEKKLRKQLRELREIQFYYTQRSQSALQDIEEYLENIRDNGLIGRDFYAPAYFEWAIWRLFLAINALVGPISSTRGFKIDDDIRPVHHAKGGAADLTFTYEDFKLVCEMTLMSGSRQFAAEGEPVTRHVFKVIEESNGKPVYGLFISKKLDPNTVDAFYKASYWKNFEKPTPTPVIALELNQVLQLLEHIKLHRITIADIRLLLDRILQLQDTHPHGPAWYKAYSKTYEQWVNTLGDSQN
jgi:AlwI restriction endonuclease